MRTLKILITIVIVWFILLAIPTLYFRYFGEGANGGSRVDYWDNSIAKTPDAFQDRISKDNVLISDVHIATDSDCEELDLNDVYQAGKNNITISFDVHTCSPNGRLFSRNYNVTGDEKDMFTYDLFPRSYRYNLNGYFPIEAVGIDCEAFGGDEYRDNEIDFAIRVKNTNEKGVVKKLSCTLEDLPSGEYTLDYYGGYSDPIDIIIE